MSEQEKMNGKKLENVAGGWSCHDWLISHYDCDGCHRSFMTREPWDGTLKKLIPSDCPYCGKKDLLPEWTERD